MNWKRLFKAFIILFVFFCQSAFAMEAPVRCQGDKVEYLRDQKVIRAEGNVILEQNNTKLTANKAIIFIESGDTYADGQVVLYHENQVFTSEKMHYNFKSGLGDVVNIDYVGIPWFSKGETGNKVSNREITMFNSYMTTCDFPEPHYRIQGREVRIYPGDCVVIHQPVVYIGKVPIFWFPRYTYPLDDERSRFSGATGHRSDFGLFVYTGYNFYQTENIKGTFKLDYREKRGFGSGADVEYQYENEVIGKILTYVLDDREYEPVGENSRSDTRYRVTWEHQQQISYDTRLISEFNVQSDKDIIRDFFRSEFRDENQRENFVDITKSTANYQMSLFVSTQIDDVFNVLERLPTFRVTTRKQRIKNTPLFYSSSHSIGFLNFNYGDDINNQRDASIVDYDSFRLDTYHDISYPKKYLGWLSLEPRFGFRVTSYSADQDGDSRVRTVFTSGFSAFTKISKTWEDIRNEYWNVNRLRHVIEPGILYSLTGKPSVDPDELLRFDGIDSINRSNRFRLSLRNKLQTQRKERTVDLLDLEIFTYYSPEYEEDGLDQAFSDVFFDFEARLFKWLKFDINLRIDTQDTSNGIETFNTDLVYYYNDILAFTFGQRYTKQDANMFVFEVDYELNSDWQLKVFQRIEAESGELQDSEFALFRDLHDWTAVASYRHRSFRDEDSFFIMFYLKEFPDLPLTIGN